MLQKLRDSASINKYVKHIERLESRSRILAEKIIDFLNLNEEYVIITYNRQGYLPASILYWFILTMEPESRVVFGDANTVSYYIVAYREPGKTLFLATNPFSGATITLLQSSSLTGNKVFFITPKPADLRLIDMLSKYDPIYIEFNDELEASLLMSMAAYHAASKHYKDKLGRRGSRLYKHSLEGFTVVINELLEKYMDQLEKISMLKEVIVSSSKILEPSSLFFVEALRRIGVKTHYEAPEQIVGPTNVLLLTTSVEEYYAREILFKMNMMNTKTIHLPINTDPLEAQIYYAVLAYYLVHSRNKT
ncbi:hypothetical protein Shell_0043 [Staphylothermus hellenicus DSM 12710]|uniref:Uncharacterized protein n=1 Tax=Staphylothermus hellenicus (strain DSM 12710 / JCM 10830 / BK20S6-10-b1 / P8) TaxID=591019 RepID=D7DAJ6_STAHD|nr:hypothetical protein Shell_0043 [Staphylothermus hellenicus DSM 12710]